MSDNQKPELVYVPGSMRTVSDKPLALRWLGGKLQYARQWTDGPMGGTEWVDVPVESTSKCDGNHGGPPCADPGCWNDDPLYASWGVYMHLRADLQGAVELARAHRTEAGSEAWVQFITSRLLHLAEYRGKLADDAAHLQQRPLTVREPLRLTDSEIDAIMDQQWGRGLQLNQYQAHRAASRAIERAVLEKIAAGVNPSDGGQDA